MLWTCRALDQFYPLPVTAQSQAIAVMWGPCTTAPANRRKSGRCRSATHCSRDAPRASGFQS